MEGKQIKSKGLTEDKICVVCNKIYKISNSGYGRKESGVRTRNSRTCSPKCSKIYYKNRNLYVKKSTRSKPQEDTNGRN